MMNNRFRKNDHREDGVALIFALTMLALLLIMLIGFLASALLEQRAAYAQGDITASQLLAKGALNRIRTQLTTYGSDNLAWMRFRSSDSKIIAPMVSIADNGDLNQETLDLDQSKSDEAYAALKPLLYRYFGGTSDLTTSEIKKNWEWRNFFPAAVKADYPQWIYYYNNPDKDQITGRVAYVIVPNYGFDPTKLSEAAAPNRIGVSYANELTLRYFTSASGATALKKNTNYLTSDFFNAKGIMDSNDKFDFSNIQSDYRAGKLGGVDNKAYKEFTTLYFNANQQMQTEKHWNGGNRTYFEYNTLKTQAEYESLLTAVNFSGSRNQVAANIRDYMDSDSVPTSDIAPADWLTSATAPTYTGLEKTPYINQIVPAVQLDFDFTGSSSSLGSIFGISLGKIVVQTLTVNKEIKLYIELVNMYPEDLKARRVILKNLRFAMELDTAGRGSFTTGKTTSFTGDVTASLASPYNVSKNGYVVLEATIVNNPTAAFMLESGVENSNADISIKVSAKITELSFDRAVLVGDVNNSEINVDYVKNIPVSNLPYTAVSEQEMTLTTGSVEKTITTYANFAVKGDPRCNLNSEDWKFSWQKTDAEMSSLAVTLGSKNSDVDASNDDLTAEKDIEKANDPAKIVAYIRNGVMKSPWELGFIHRGKSFQTINLKSALIPGQTGVSDITYLNDGMLMDKLRFNNASENKFNINYPPSRPGVFGLLTANLKYHPEGKINAHEVSETANLDDLSDDAAAELARWIALKCYNAGGDDPDANGAKVYAHYASRAQLVNVITDWALNGKESPFKGDLASDIHIEEFIGKIVPLTRCGESFEYFTAFVVAQSIKDVKGTMYVFDGDGNITKTKTGLAHGGKVESEIVNNDLHYYDKITSETFMVVRMYRDLTSCEKTENCFNGIHGENCKFTIKVLESYTLSEP